MSLRSSPRQKRIEQLRRAAAAQGVKVQLARRADARDDERSLDSVSYRLPWGPVEPKEFRPWTLVQNNQRGMETQWGDWRWFKGPSSVPVERELGALLEQLPPGVTALLADRAGVVVHWTEEGEEQQVDAIVEGLKAVRKLMLSQ
ncbi:hypothetical protein QP938_05890 [Porticoccaceae bacterium LTM1]|nr:hypothetical protein QP938_05890 [Porticoccaceae bacterium LTM1]